MRVKLVWSLLVTAACLFGATNLAAKVSTVDDGYYTTKDKEFYLTSEQLLLIRPGLVVEITDVTLPADMQLVVTFSIADPAGLPLDNTGVTTPGAVDFRFTLANIPMSGEQKVRLAYERASRNGTLTSLGDGVYKYKFDYVMDSDQDTTHTLVLGFRRDLREFDLDRYAANDLYNWVPSGIYAPVPRDIVTTETCNRCHDPLALHGSRWLLVAACTQCHNPATYEDVPFDTVIHALHAGGEAGRHDFSHIVFPAEINDCQICHTGGTPTDNFPMVASPSAALVCDSSGNGETTLTWQHSAGVEIQVRSVNNPDGTLFARGGKTGSASTGKWVKDGTVFEIYDAGTMDLLQSVPVNTTVLGCLSNAPGTFVGEAAAQHTNWMDHPSRRVCSSCHVDVDFETGEGHIALSNDDSCHFCHKPIGTEYDLSITGAHQVLYKSAQLPGIAIEILSVTNTNPGDNPTVTFSMGTKSGSLAPSELPFFNLVITGPNEDFSFFAAEFAVFGAVWVSENTYAYTFNTPLPDDAAGSFTAGAEAFSMVSVQMGNEVTIQRHTAENYAFAFAVTDTNPVPRRVVVDDDKCESCHSNLALHGTIRHDVQYCVTCHNPAATDVDELQEGAMEQSIHFKYMVHKIHRGAELENGYVVAGHNQSVHDYGHVEYPGDLRNCDKCHVNDSQQLSLPAGLLETTTPQEWWDPMMPVASACLSCHDSDNAAAHAYANTTFFGESCATCHGEGKEASVDKVHAH